MSADTFTGLAKFKDGYRICFGQAPENLTIGAKYELKEYFGGSPVYTTREGALLGIHMMEEGLRAETQEDGFYYENEHGLIEFNFSNKRL